MNVSRAKINMIRDMLQLVPEVTVVVSDIDVAWMRNPLPFFQRFPEVIVTATLLLCGLWCWRHISESEMPVGKANPLCEPTWSLLFI